MVYKGKKDRPSDVQYMKSPDLIVKKLNSAELLTCLKEAELHAEHESNI